MAVSELATGRGKGGSKSTAIGAMIASALLSIFAAKESLAVGTTAVPSSPGGYTASTNATKYVVNPGTVVGGYGFEVASSTSGVGVSNHL